MVSKCLAEKESHETKHETNLAKPETNDVKDLLLSVPTLQTFDLVAAEGKHKHYKKKKGHWKKKGGKKKGAKKKKHSHGKWGGGYKHAAHNYKKHHKHGGYV